MQGCWWVNKRKGSKQVSKTTYSDKNCWPTHRHWQWGTEGGSALVPKIVPSTGQANRFLYEAREQKMQEIFFSTYSIIRKLKRVSSHFLQDTVLWQFLKCCTIPTTVDLYRFVADWKGESWKLTACWNCLGVPAWFIPSPMVTITQQQHEPCQSCWIIQCEQTNYLSMRIFSPAWITPFNCNVTERLRNKGLYFFECSSCVNI